MPIVSLSGIPAGTPRLEQLAAAIKRCIAGIPELHLDESGITVFFPADMLPRDGSEIIATVRGLFHTPERTFEVRQDVWNAVGVELQDFVLHKSSPIPAWNLIEVIMDPPLDLQTGWGYAGASKNRRTC